MPVIKYQLLLFLMPGTEANELIIWFFSLAGKNLVFGK